MMTDNDLTRVICLKRPDFDGVTPEWKPFSVKPILVHPVLRKQDKLLFCFACSLFQILRFSCVREHTVDSLCLRETYA